MSEMTLIEDAVDAGIDAASEYVGSLLPIGQRAWGDKEYGIAETAARAAIAALQESIKGGYRT